MSEDEFSCEFCCRPSDPSYTGPTVEDDASPMPKAEVWALYQDRRWLHLDQDFRRSDGVRKHLEARARYWFSELPVDREALGSAMSAIDAEVEMWEHRRTARAQARKAAA